MREFTGRFNGAVTGTLTLRNSSRCRNGNLGLQTMKAVLLLFDGNVAPVWFEMEPDMLNRCGEMP